MKITIFNSEFVLDIYNVIEMKDIPLELVFNQDQTESVLFQDQLTMEVKGWKSENHCNQ